jgi:hypothetical protein
VSEDLRRAVAFLGWETAPEAVVRLGYGLAVPVAGATLLATWFLAPGAVLLSTLLAASLGLGTAHAVHRLPVGLAALRRTRALGRTADLVGRAALRMRLEPAPERAAAFAARTGEGPLAETLASHVERARGTPTSGLGAFADEWSGRFPALDRSASLLLTSADAPAGERERSLERAVDAVLDGTRDRMAEFAGTVRGPATAVYAFGVLLPLALVGVLPAARAGGVSVPTAAFVAVYDLLLPLVLVGASAWLLVRRPVALPPPRVTRDHPDVPDGAARGLAAGAVGALGGWFAGGLVTPWGGPVAALGGGLGLGLTAHYRPAARVRRRVRAAESRLDDALYLVGRRVADGTSVEAAIADAADAVDGETGALFEAADGVRRRLRVSVREAFLGDHGALATLPSPRVRATAALLAVAATEGRPSGKAVVATADHLRDLRRVERDSRRQLAAVTGTLSNTAALFAPLVAGATVAMAARMAAADASLVGVASGGSTVSTGTLGVAVGFYVVVLAVLLTTLATGLDRGLDRSLVGYRVGLAVLSATAAYFGAVRGAAMLF